MNRAVIDTNVLVSANISSGGSPAKIMSLFYTGKLQLFYSKEILAEYERVLSYKKLGIPTEAKNDIIKAIKAGGTLIEAPASTVPMPDETDRKFYDAAKASEASLITGNLKHYPIDALIVNPTGFLAATQ